MRRGGKRQCDGALKQVDGLRVLKRGGRGVLPGSRVAQAV